MHRSSEESEEDSEDSEEKKPVEAPKVQPKGAAAFMKGGDSDDSDDDDRKRVVRSHRDKKWDQMVEAVNELKGHVKANDWVHRTQ